MYRFNESGVLVELVNIGLQDGIGLEDSLRHGIRLEDSITFRYGIGFTLQIFAATILFPLLRANT